MSLAAIRSELAGVVKAAAPQLTVYPYDVADPHLPAAVITWSDPIDFQGGTADQALRFDLVVRLMVGDADELLTSQGLDRLASSAIPAAIRDAESTAWNTANPSLLLAPDAEGGAVAIDLVVAIHARINESENQ